MLSTCTFIQTRLKWPPVNRETSRERERETDRQRQRDRQTDRQTETKTERNRDTEIELSLIHI